MRHILHPAVLAFAALGLQIGGCATDQELADDGSSSGDGGSGVGGSGVGGEGGAACAPEAELCDGLDNDCDEQVDEDCDCEGGDTQGCYSGRPPRTAGLGECIAGTQTCGLRRRR